MGTYMVPGAPCTGNQTPAPLLHRRYRAAPLPPDSHPHAPHPNISPLIDDTVALHREKLRGPVGNGAPLGCPVLEQWPQSSKVGHRAWSCDQIGACTRSGQGLGTGGQKNLRTLTCRARAWRELSTWMRACFMEPKSIKTGCPSSPSKILVGFRSLSGSGNNP